MERKEYYEWINIARGIGMLLVVLGHAADDTWVRSGSNSTIANYLINFIYSFHMPLFFFLSGFCAAKILNLAGTKEKCQYISSRFKRLMIPYITVGIIYVPIKLVMASEVTAKVNWRSLLPEFLIGVNPNGQLWTLYALFVIALFFVLISQIGKKNMVMVSLFLCVISVFYDFKTSIIQRSTYECFFFMIGIVMHEWWKKDGKQLVAKYNMRIISFILLLTLIGLNCLKEFGGLDYLKFFTAIVGIVFICALSINIEGHACKMLNEIGTYSMDIYIMANIIQVLSRSVFLNRLHLPNIICCLLSLVLGIIFPVFASKYVIRKNRILKGIILGDF